MWKFENQKWRDISWNHGGEIIGTWHHSDGWSVYCGAGHADRWVRFTLLRYVNRYWGLAPPAVYDCLIHGRRMSGSDLSWIRQGLSYSQVDVTPQAVVARSVYRYHQSGLFEEVLNLAKADHMMCLDDRGLRDHQAAIASDFGRMLRAMRYIDVMEPELAALLGQGPDGRAVLTDYAIECGMDDLAHCLTIGTI